MLETFRLDGRTAVVTGGYGVLGGTMAAGLAAAGARVAILGRSRARAEAKCDELRASGAEALPLVADVLDEESLRAARARADTTHEIIRPLMSPNPFDLTGRVAVVTGGYGVLGGSMADALARAGARVAILGRRRDQAQLKVDQLRERRPKESGVSPCR